MRSKTNAVLRSKNIIEFIRDPRLINSDLSPYQETALRLAYGLPLSKEQKVIAKECLDIAKLEHKSKRLPKPRNYNCDFVRSACLNTRLDEHPPK